MTAELQLLSAHLTGGLERVAWWNGRIVTAEDMTDQQRATDGADRRLGRALGAGVVRGLGATRRPDGRSVDVTAGIAVDAAGDVLELPTDVVVHLVRPPSQPAPTEPADFVRCDVVPTAAQVSGTGVYLLTIASAAGTRGSAPGAPEAGAATCGPRYEVAGVQFRLVEIDAAGLAQAGGHDDADLAVLATLTSGTRHPRLRNVLAHVLLDSRARRQALLDPFGPPYTPALRRLADGALVGCEVPLALVAWAAGRAEFVDVWSARRPPAPAAAPAPTWPARFVGDHGGHPGQAVLLQAVDHVRDLVGPGTVPADRITVEARQHFRYLPAALLVPHTGPGRPHGFDLDVFLTGLDVQRGEPMAAGRVWPLLTASLTAPVTDLDSDDGLHRYRVVEAVAAGAGQPYVVLAADHLRHLALADPDDDDRVVITAVSPPGDHEIGDRITVHGRHFAVPAGRNTVTVGRAPVVTFYAGSSATALVLDVPAVRGVPRTAPLVVTNEDGSAEWLLSIVEKVAVPKGVLVLVEDFGDVAGQELEEGKTVTFYWQVQALTDVVSTYVFEPVITAATGVPASAWLATAVPVDAGGDVRKEFEIEPFERRGMPVGIRLTVPVGAESAHLALRSHAPAAPDDPRLNVTSSPAVLVVGKKTGTSDPRITFGAPTLDGAGSVTDDGALVVRVGEAVRVAVPLRFTEGAIARYDAAVEPTSAQERWSLTNPKPAPEVSQAEEPGAEGAVAVTVRPRSPERAEALLRIRVSAQAAHSGEEYTSTVRLTLRTP